MPDEWKQAMDGLLARPKGQCGDTLEYWDFGVLEELSDADYRDGDHT